MCDTNGGAPWHESGLSCSDFGAVGEDVVEVGVGPVGELGDERGQAAAAGGEAVLYMGGFDGQLLAAHDAVVHEDAQGGGEHLLRQVGDGACQLAVAQRTVSVGKGENDDDTPLGAEAR